MKDSIHISLPLEMTDEEVKQAGNIDMTKAEKFGGLNHFYELKYDISNGAVLDMPKTGDNGFWKFGILGFGLMAATFAVMTKRKRKNKGKRPGGKNARPLLCKNIKITQKNNFILHIKYTG